MTIFFRRCREIDKKASSKVGIGLAKKNRKFSITFFESWIKKIAHALSPIVSKILFLAQEKLIYCSDFRYESNGIFVLGVGFFFFRQNSTFN